MRRPRCSRRARAGQTLLEVLVGFTALVIGLLSFAKVLTLSSASTQVSHDVAVATEAARATLESLRDVDFDEVFARYNETAADDPAGAAAPGCHFAVDGLMPRPDDEDGFAGRISFPIRPGAPGELREDLTDPRFGTPRDLDGSGGVDSNDHSGDYRVLPVLVRVEWRGASGSSQVELKTLLVDMP